MSLIAKNKLKLNKPGKSIFIVFLYTSQTVQNKLKLMYKIIAV